MLIAWTQSFTLGGAPAERRTLMATVRLEPYERRVVRPHERTHEGPKADRLRLTRAVGVNLSPVFGLYPDAGRRGVAAGRVAGPPDAELDRPRGHGAPAVADRRPGRRSAPSSRALADRWILIADGHHRYETALAYSRERAGGRPGDDGTDRPRGPRAGGAPHPSHADGVAGGRRGGLRRDPGGRPRGAAGRPWTRPRRARRRPSGWCSPAGPRSSPRPPLADPSPAAALDTAVLEREVLVPAFGEDQAALTARGVLGYVKDAAEAWRLVREGGAAAAIVVRPTTKAQVAAVAEAGETMPQKSTYFFPKLLTGVAYHPLDGD